MSVTNFNSISSIYKLSQQLNEIENKLNHNLLDEIERIALIPDLENMFLEIENEASELQTRLTILRDESTENHEEIEFDLSSIKKIKGVWEGVYQSCVRAQIFSLTQICNKTEIALTSNQQISSNHYHTLKNIQQMLAPLKDNPHLSEQEKSNIKGYLSQVEKLLSLFQEHLQIEDLSLQTSDIGMLSYFPEEILLQFFSFLSPQDLTHLSKCNKYLHNLCVDNFFWKNILQQEFFPFTLAVPENTYAKEVYISQNSMIKSLEKSFYTHSTIIDEKINACCFTKDGNLSFTGSYDKTIKVWDLTDLKNIQCIASFAATQDDFSMLYHQGSLLFSGSWNGAIQVWDLSDLANVRCIATLTAHENAINNLLLKDNLLFSASSDDDDGPIRVWDLSDLSNIHCIATLEGHEKSVVSFSCKDNFLFSASSDNTIKVWNLGESDIPCIATLTGHEKSIRCLQTQGSFLFSGSSDNTIRIWDLSKNNFPCIATLTGHENVVSSLESQDHLLFSGSRDKTMKVWDLRINKCIGTLKGHSGDIVNMKKKGNYLFSGSLDNTLKVWDLNVSLEDTLFSLVALLKGTVEIESPPLQEEALKAILERIAGLPLLIRLSIYSELNEMQMVDFVGSSEQAFLETNENGVKCNKKIEAIHRYLLKRVIELFNNGDSKEAIALFNKFPYEIKFAIQSKVDSDGFSLIEAIEAFLNKTKIEK